LPAATQLLYRSARLELRAREPGFAHRLRRDAEALIEDAPDFAEAHALRAVACSYALDDAVTPSRQAAAAARADLTGPLRCARESSRRALELDTTSPFVMAAARFAVREQLEACATGRVTCPAPASRVTAGVAAYHPGKQPFVPAAVRLARTQ
jgi:hypothetical protein